MPSDTVADDRLKAVAREMREELAKNYSMLLELRDKHLSHCAAVVKALVQKRIEATDAVMYKAHHGKDRI